MAAKLPRILIVDDEPQILRFLRASLPPHGYECVEAGTRRRGASRPSPPRAPDAVILDLGLPDQDGFAVIQAIRASALTPIIVLSARSDVEGKVRALELGADDYVTKPFDMAELLARLKAALRHGLQAVGEAPVFRTGAAGGRSGQSPGHAWATRKSIFRPRNIIFCAFWSAHAGKVVTHQQLLKEVWGPAHVEDVQYLRVLMRQLRQKIEPDNAVARLLITEPSVGYRLLVQS